MKKQFPDFEVTESMIPYLLVAEANTPLEHPEPPIGQDCLFVSVSSPQDLINFKPITHRFWLEDWDYEWINVEKDVNLGKTFAFYWKEDALAWER